MTKIYVSNLSFQTKQEEMEKYFAVFGKIKSCILMTQRGHSKGFGFVEYETEEETKKALAANDLEFMGRKLHIQIAQPLKEHKENHRHYERRFKYSRRGISRRYFNRKEKDYQHDTNDNKTEENNELSETLLFIRNLSYSINDKKLKELFAKYEPKEAIVVSYKKGSRIFSKGFGFVEVSNKEQQNAAIIEFNNFEIDGRKIIVSAGYKRQERIKSIHNE
ncbi:29 kDa ribonucleoprotein B, chloroplast precursor, putative [Entamoeba dispar SAW760]|uniref:29 kDa ribonucleoprotein B, chloroplast, putative n=1 Tax=Entamoeba dispar (strain ATCC PRA-260 / SAW760) TaxID=370354 RepID=B0EN29_ENTDS|nr:29 kDa ribonucleoprotein B, chloroplast precursor, putative [Entamoeba dispar SAW760]EDR24054.1 29 kDa ribonucleoprotein B, chloroplast precursor, putative [Entamoeba dispar SAW760]|eukprot:EDR24054.1 29 kDa ribonucleoprotein B, chloroplast precursor, putative [Entamoeba dispar SAW760]